MEVNKNDRYINKKLFIEAFGNETQFSFKDGINPMSIELEGKLYYIFIKNLTPAQLSNNNPNVWRVQLPIKEEFAVIKNTDDMFIMLGYDSERDVYATWNPYWIKQRLNIGESVSLYSRLTLQIEANIKKDFVKYELSQGEVIVFPRMKINQYIKNIATFFPSNTKYIPITSSLRKQKQMQEVPTVKKSIILFNYLTDIGKLVDFKNYLASTKLVESTQKSYVGYIRFININGYLEKHKDVFMNNPNDIKKALSEFCSTDDISYIDRSETGGWHGAIRASLKKYLKYFETCSSINSQVILDFDDNKSTKENPLNKTAVFKTGSYPVEINSTIIKKVYSIISESGLDDFRILEALSTYYKDKYKNEMTMMDWLKFIKETDWNLLYCKIK